MIRPQLFYLIGFQRSGTTLLCQLLDRHPEILCIDEPEISKRIVYGQVDKLADVNSDSIRKVIEFYGVNPSSYTELVASFQRREYSEGIFLRKCYELCNTGGASCIGAKEVCELSSYPYGYIRNLIRFHRGDAKFIFMERDIKAVINSFIKLGFYTPEKKSLTKRNMMLFAKQYIKCVNNADKLLAKQKVCTVIFEDLLTRGTEELNRIFHFLKVDASPEIINKIINTDNRGIRRQYCGFNHEVIDAWRGIISEDDVRWLDNLYLKKRHRRCCILKGENEKDI